MIKDEIVESSPLAVVVGGGEVSGGLVALLEKQRIRVRRLLGITDALSVLEKPNYVFFFCEQEPDDLGMTRWREMLDCATRSGARIILVLDNVSVKWENWALEEAKNVGWPVQIVELVGGFSGKELEEVISRLIRLVFTAGKASKKVMIEGNRARRPTAQREVSVQEVWEKLNRWEKTSGGRFRVRMPQLGRKSIIGLVVATILLLLVIGPVVMVGGETVLGARDMVAAKDFLEQGKFDQAGAAAAAAKVNFGNARGIVQITDNWWSLVGLRAQTEQYYNILLLGDTGAQTMEHAALVAPKAIALGENLWNGSESGETIAAQSSALAVELSSVETDLGLIESQIGAIPPLGIISEKLDEYENQLPQIRQLVHQSQKALVVMPEIIGATGQSTIGTVPGRRTYLVVFQNSTELRPTGGFIGSYAIVNFDSGKLLDYKVNDIYSADGQLVGRIAPPDEILHYLGQTSWYMRDANWAVDWPLTAKRLEWFLEKETGVQVDGVIGVSLPAVAKMLTATGPLPLPDLGDTVDADSFYQKAEYAAEINFFPGSTQKRDYVGAVSQALLDKFTSGIKGDWLSLGQALSQAVLEKDMLFYFNSSTVQAAMAENNWDGSLDSYDCSKKGTNCLALSEANLGANKANYFIKRGIQVRSVIDKGEGVETTVTVNYRNDSPSVTWPGGDYKNYVRFLVPTGSQFLGFDLGDGRMATVSSTLTAAVLASVPTNKFLVFTNPELTATDQAGATSSWTAYGALLELPIQTSRTITFRYRSPYRMALTGDPSYDFVFLKQPGTGGDPLDLILDYPSFLTTVEKPILALTQRVIYNTDLSIDRVFNIKFKKQVGL